MMANSLKTERGRCVRNSGGTDESEIHWKATESGVEGRKNIAPLEGRPLVLLKRVS